MGRHHEDDPERRRQGGLRWKGDTTGSIPRVPAWVEHEGITEGSVDAFVAGLRSSNPPGMEKPPGNARYSWLIERCSQRTFSGAPVRQNAWVRIASGYTEVDYPTSRAAAIDMMRTWFLWNGIVQPEVRRLHTIWTRHATEAAWSERLDGR